ncbi:hypothetical protein [Nitrososphaera sp.]|uniref:hypothetical protein n=1 Tax=Nitrososphaera sp. TaxID=1971748 RepID=UPI003172F525
METVAYETIKNQIIAEFEKIIGEPSLIGESEKEKSDLDMYHLSAIDEVIKEMLQIKADRAIVPNDPVLHLTHERMNKFMLYINKQPVSKSFFDYFFNSPKAQRKASSLSKFRHCVNYFRIVAMLRYGSFKRALVELSKEDDVPAILKDLEPKSPDEIKNTEGIIQIDEIPSDDLFLLGYIAGTEPEKVYEKTISMLQTLVGVLEKGDTFPMDTFWTENDLPRQLIMNHFSEDVRKILPSKNIEKFKDLLKKTEQLKSSCKLRQELAKKKAISNTHRYLTAHRIDIYFATSMRNPMDFLEMNKFVERVMKDPSLAPLNLNGFDPTLSYTNDLRAKGLIECLMLKRSKATVYVAGETDSLGKDSELATTLAQGKPTIVYVPEGETFNKRADTFRIRHPLGMQIELSTGVAHGVLVVRTPEQCARLLFDIFTNNMEFEIMDGEQSDSNDENYYLIEKNYSKSPYRIVTKNLLLNNCFWNLYFDGKEKAKNGLKG